LGIDKICQAKQQRFCDIVLPEGKNLGAGVKNCIFAALSELYGIKLQK
jgi:hypothetical protein